MDLRELKDKAFKRHPWEVSRIEALRSILKDTATTDIRVLDVGCGDGYVLRELFKDKKDGNITGVDINLTERQIEDFTGRGGGIKYMNKLPETAERYDLILLLDVLEHVPDDLSFLAGDIKKRLAENGRILISTPAFNALYSSHDEFLGHFRRYNVRKLKGLVEKAGLKGLSSGYFFTLLLLPRVFLVCAEKIFRVKAANRGVGGWEKGGLVTSLIVTVLRADIKISFMLNRLGVNLPGLSSWILCEKQR
ncbi:MAG: class I SAM-dependent methyltransferase [Thermodesulfobacteriota bacterium]